MRFLKAFTRSWPAVWLLIAVLFWVGLDKPYENGPAIRSDGVGYHLWTYGFRYLDFELCQFADLIGHTQSFSSQGTTDHTCLLKYPAGVALLRLPLMLPFSHPKAMPENERKISKAEHNMSLFSGSIALLIIVFQFIHMATKFGMDRRVIQWTILLFVFGTGLFHYATYDNSFSHIYSAVCVSSLVFVAFKMAEKITAGYAVGLFLLSLLTVMIRFTNVLILMPLCLLYMVYPWRTSQDAPIIGWQKKFCYLLPVAAGVLSGLLVQGALNYGAVGEFKLWSYGQESFENPKNYFFEVLFSYERGLFTYYPVVLVALLLSLCHRSTRLLGFVNLVIIAAFAGLYGQWHSWYLGGGFGHRGFIEVLPQLMIPMALGFKNLSECTFRWFQGVTLILMGGCLSFMVGYWQGTLPFAGNSYSNYWKHWSLYPLCFLPFAVWMFGLVFRNFYSKKNP